MASLSQSGGWGGEVQVSVLEVKGQAPGFLRGWIFGESEPSLKLAPLVVEGKGSVDPKDTGCPLPLFCLPIGSQQS